MYKLFLISIISSYAYSVTPSFSAIVVLEQQNSNLNGVNWDKIENQANQQGLKNANGLLYNKKIDKICSDC